MHQFPRKKIAMKVLDIHCAIDDGFAMCGGNAVPRVPYNSFVYLGKILTSAHTLGRWPCQRCRSCVAMISTPPDSGLPT